MAGSTIPNAPSGEKTTPDGTEKIPVSGSQFVQMLNFIGRKLRETSGPTTLSMGAVVDGRLTRGQALVEVCLREVEVRCEVVGYLRDRRAGRPP